jgi:hypothetical protein
MRRFEIQRLECRVLLSAAAPEMPVIAPIVMPQSAPAFPLIPAQNTPSQALNATVRQQIVNHLNAGSLKTTLTPLVNSAAAFDQALLDYMRTNTTSRFFFGPSNLASRITFIEDNLLQGSAQARADELLLHQFPEQADSPTYDVQLPDNIDWDNTGYSANAEFLPYLNRFEYWLNLGQAYQYTTNTNYVQEIVNQLASWCIQNPTADPATWATTGGVGWDLLNTSLRTEQWIWTYQMVLSSSTWTKEANTLFIARMWEHGDFMSSAVGYEATSNRALFHAKSLLMLSQVFPEFAGSGGWEPQARDMLFTAMDAQLYSDGSQVEQSPNYTALVIDDILEAKYLDELNGDLTQWPAEQSAKVTNAVESFRQMLSPDATMPAIGDTYRTTFVTMFTKAALIQDLITVKQSAVNDASAAARAVTYPSLKVDDASQFSVGDEIHLQDKTELMLVTAVNLGTNTLTVERGYAGTTSQQWADNRTVHNLGNKTVARARMRDVLLFGDAAMEPFIDIPATPALGARGKTKALTDAGYYIARSGDDESSNQLIFDAGPTGGIHGHFDLLNFELFGGGRPLIADPGTYIYGDGADRNYVISTRAHNTISVGTGSHAAVEGRTNPAFSVDDYDVTGSSMQITAHHHAYQSLPGRPLVSRSMWYDLDGTILIVDWGDSSVSQTFTQSFNIPTEGGNNVGGVLGDGSFKTAFPTGGNVKVAPVSIPGQVVARGAKTFVTNTSSGNVAPYKDEAYRFTVVQSGTFVYFVTLITAYDGTTAPNTTATVLTSNIGPGDTIQVELTKNGVPQTIDFDQPHYERPSLNFGDVTGGANDIEYDSSGRLHMVFWDRNDTTLKYAVQETNGIWSILETIDNNPYSGVYLSLALDSNGLPGVAYYDGNNGDLRYAKYSNGAWDKVTVDSLQNVGLYPSLVFSRNNGPVISYYHRTKMDLRLAIAQVGGFSITTVDSAGDVGRATSMRLDPNRTDASKFAIAYEDTSNGDMKYAIQGPTAAFNYYVADDMVISGGYASLAFFDSGNADPTKRWMPSISYYDAFDTALRYAYTVNGTTWSSQRIAFNGNQGLYTSLFYDLSGRANIFYFDRTSLTAKRAKKIGANWTVSALLTGGREMNVAMKSTGALAYTTLDESLPRLDVQFLGS